ncbi:hypothetical protein R3P38DRAFT_3228616 [Favolaschia claudopus]|uniref:ATP synthase protein MI25 n=1 Tax=Favolaschia claudopus TaxID=2862362 RepID=A0AAV9ZPZ6_9AGAR
MRNILQSTYSATVPAVIGAGLAIVSGHTILFIGLLSFTLLSHAINRYRPSSQFARLKNAIKKTKKFLSRANTFCSQHVDWHAAALQDLKGRMDKVESTSLGIDRQLLQTQHARGWITLAFAISDTVTSMTRTVEAVKNIPKAVKEYVQNVWLLSEQISECADQVKELERSIQSIMLNERQRRFDGSPRECDTSGTNGMNSTGADTLEQIQPSP